MLLRLFFFFFFFFNPLFVKIYNSIPSFFVKKWTLNKNMLNAHKSAVLQNCSKVLLILRPSWPPPTSPIELYFGENCLLKDNFFQIAVWSSPSLFSYGEWEGVYEITGGHRMFHPFKAIDEPDTYNDRLRMVPPSQNCSFLWKLFLT